MCNQQNKWAHKNITKKQGKHVTHSNVTKLRCVRVSVCYSSGVVWEMKPKNRWKPFSQKNINLLEKTYQSQQSRQSPGGWVKLETNLEVRGQCVHINKHVFTSLITTWAVTRWTSAPPPWWCVIQSPARWEGTSFLGSKWSSSSHCTSAAWELSCTGFR